MYQNPRKAKRLTFDVIPKAVDEYQSFSEKFPSQELKEKINNPVFHINEGDPKIIESPVTFSLILNLVSASQSDSREVIWGFLKEYYDDISNESREYIDGLVGFALEFYKIFVFFSNISKFGKIPSSLSHKPNRKSRTFFFSQTIQ